MMLLLVILAGFLVALLTGILFDSRWTIKGIEANLSTEANTWLVGTRPTAGKMYLRDLIYASMAIALPLIFFFVNQPVASYASLSGCAVLAGKHVYGGWRWMQLFRSKS